MTNKPNDHDAIRAQADEMIGDLTDLTPEQIEERFRQAHDRSVERLIARPNKPGNEAHTYTPPPLTKEIDHRWEAWKAEMERDGN